MSGLIAGGAASSGRQPVTVIELVAATISAPGGTLVGGGHLDGLPTLELTKPDIPEEDDMTGHAHDSSADRAAVHDWVLTAWVLPLAVAGGITILTAGFGAITIVVAIMIGLMMTALHRWGPSG